MYSPDGKQPWDDAVTLVLTYAEIPYDVIYDAEIMSGVLPVYDWLHLHHEDFTGQYGKFYRSYRSAAWYQDEVARQEGMARTLGFNKVSVMKRNVALQIRDFVLGGGFLFTMCSGTDSFDIALAAEEVDICQAPFDGDPAEPGAAQKLDYDRGLAFHDYQIITDPMVYEFSDIDATESTPNEATQRLLHPVRLQCQMGHHPHHVDPEPRAGHSGLHGADHRVPQTVHSL